MFRYYLSGPMTGLPEFNYPAFNDAAAILRAEGITVINPAENFHGAMDLPREQYMKRDVELLLDCHAIVMLKGWEKSAGARLELEIAKQIGLNAYRLTDDSELEFLEETLSHHAEADRLVNGARQSDYGHPLDDFSKTAAIWSAILETNVTPEQVALCMVGVKLSREINKPKRDNIVDAHGYLMTYVMVQEELERRKQV